MCECYQVGGPWIAEDPDCPIHGAYAQQQESVRVDELEQLHQRISKLEDIVQRQQEQINRLKSPKQF